ncbi:MAG: hypothetical protein AB8B73_08410 [Ekhidna sp.]
MRNIYLKQLLISIIAFLLFSCEEEPTFVCEQNTVFQFAGSSEKWCGRSETRQYNNDNGTERGSIFIRYPAGNVILSYSVPESLVVGQLMSSESIGLSGDIGTINEISMVVTKLDREQELMSFTFDFDYHAHTNLTHWDVIGTVTDIALSVE